MSEFLTSLMKSMYVSLGIIVLFTGMALCGWLLIRSFNRFDVFLTKHFPTFMERVEKKELTATAIYFTMVIFILMLTLDIADTAINLYILK